jgi:glycosyltransferase involved in cell wall biosynthesis
MEKGLISVIVPVYNVEKYLEKCVNSIINQTYNNLEIILVDDGSKDNSGKLCDEFSKKDFRIKVIHKENGGLSDARNAGLEVASGEYISFIDSDDFIDLDFYEYLYLLQKENNADIAECNFIKVYEEKIDTFEFPRKKEEAILKTDGVGALFLFMSDDDEISTNSVVVWNKLYKKKLFDNIRFPVGKTHEDQFTTYKILAEAKSFVTSNQIKYGYFQRTNSIVNKKFNKKRFDTFEAFDKFLEYYDFMGYDEFKEKILRRYIKTAINFVPLLSTSDEAEKMELKESLRDIFENKYNYIIDYISKSDIHYDKQKMYSGLKDEFERQMSQIV